MPNGKDARGGTARTGILEWLAEVVPAKRIVFRKNE